MTSQQSPYIPFSKKFIDAYRLTLSLRLPLFLLYFMGSGTVLINGFPSVASLALNPTASA